MNSGQGNSISGGGQSLEYSQDEDDIEEMGAINNKNFEAMSSHSRRRGQEMIKIENEQVNSERS